LNLELSSIKFICIIIQLTQALYTSLKPDHYGFKIDPLVSMLKFKHIISYFSY